MAPQLAELPQVIIDAYSRRRSDNQSNTFYFFFGFRWRSSFSSNTICAAAKRAIGTQNGVALT